VPKLRVNLTRFQGGARLQKNAPRAVTPAKRGKGNKRKVPDEAQTSAERMASMTWAVQESAA